MNRRSFLQAIAGAVASLAGLSWGRKVAIIESGGDGVYSWREVTLEFDPNGYVLSASVNPGGRFGIAGQCDAVTEVWRRS